MSRIRCFAGLAAVAVLVGAASLAQAQNWSVPSGNWSNPNNWSPAGVPNNESAAITIAELHHRRLGRRCRWS